MNTTEKPYSQSSENNKQPILEQLTGLFKDVNSVLEIGSGTGQHAVFFANHLPHLQWHTSDLTVNHAGIELWLDENPQSNLHPPKTFCIGDDQWPIPVDAVFTANTTHIMQPENAKQMMEMVAENLPKGGLFCQYGPFNLDEKYTSDSNRQFDQWLAERDYGGIRDIVELQKWAGLLYLDQTIIMPANNNLLVWKKSI